MILINLETKEELKGIIEKVSKKEIGKLKGNKNFTFDWSIEKDKEVYKIRLKDKKTILGLISLIDYSSEIRIHLNLLESRKDQRGKNKKIGNIAGCLIAYACRASFKRGHGGFVSLLPKTELISYYENYGFKRIGTVMAIWEENSQKLITKYFRDEEI